MFVEVFSRGDVLVQDLSSTVVILDEMFVERETGVEICVFDKSMWSRERRLKSNRDAFIVSRVRLRYSETSRIGFRRLPR